jgi:putative effector of murein hydrolase
MDNKIFSQSLYKEKKGIIMTEHPLFMVLLTLITFVISEKIFTKLGKFPLLNPVLVTIIIIISLINLFDIPYSQYKEGTQVFNYLIAPAIIALAVPLYQNIKEVKSSLPLVLFTTLISGIGIFTSVLLLGLIFGLPDAMIEALTTKSITLPIALEIAKLTGGSFSLVVIGVFSTGLPGVIIVPIILKFLKVEDEALQGLVLGITSHAFGIVRALAISPIAAAFATMGMVIMGCFAVVAVPIILNIAGF